MYTIDGPIILKFGNAVEEIGDILNRKRCGGSQKNDETQNQKQNDDD